MPRRCTGILRERRDNRREIEVAIADMEHDHAARCELAVIKGERLTRHQVDRDAIRTEGVEHDQIIAMVEHLAKRQTAIAQYHTRMVAAGLHEMEKAGVARQSLDLRIDFVEGPGLARPRVAAEAAGAKAQDAHPPHITAAYRREETAERPLRTVIARRSS